MMGNNEWQFIFFAHDVMLCSASIGPPQVPYASVLGTLWRVDTMGWMRSRRYVDEVLWIVD